MANKKIIIGILGGIGSGKTTVAREFERLGCGLIDADRMAHKLLEDEHIKSQILNLFGTDICRKNGQIDRDKLGVRVFENAMNVSKIDAIIHPGVFCRCEEMIEQFNGGSDVRAIVLDMPLLVESGWDKRCDKLVFVQCDEEIRYKRIEKHYLLSGNNIKKRENFQISLDKKADIAQYTVSNNSDLSVLTEQVE